MSVKNLNEVRNKWIAMFEHIDDMVELVSKKYPEFRDQYDINIIQDAVKVTSRLDKILEQAIVNTDKNQEEMFNDAN
tara:strand:- start:10668 stop:10898 length:231 start_codon:yes stop_codon:yes gene_type:complete